MTDYEDTLPGLAERVKALEMAAATPAYAPLNGMVVDDDGAISYDFEGTVHATGGEFTGAVHATGGVRIDASDYFNPPPDVGPNSLAFHRANDGSVAARITGTDRQDPTSANYKRAGLNIEALSRDGGVSDALLSLMAGAVDVSGPTPASVKVILSDDATSPQQHASATVLDSSGRSSFLGPTDTVRALSPVFSFDTGSIAAGATTSFDVVSVPLAGDYFVVGSLRNVNGAEQICWTYGAFGTGIRMVFRNLGPNLAAGHFVGFVATH